ncbi:hypothetical protein Runsl_3574 [Runella slithyformis DSM 19594]|uniref:Uncharacterized protein n=1 Tax=Runella slithyformis (strain ATCC 29530 / DSM 19594 / LMG 11500 / NCIMB 11436 / LSU 4) TaxID=761193 RepID=A0A7U3ZMG7_RUNSL|nr:hypothetical protein Runsl_3574 [Runella slithyformis DSM 19594]
MPWVAFVNKTQANRKGIHRMREPHPKGPNAPMKENETSFGGDKSTP